MTIANVVARIGTFISNLIVIRLLGLELLGQLGLIETWLSLAGMFSLFGLSSASTRFVARFLDDEASKAGEYAGASLLLSGIFAAVVCGVVYAGLWAVPGSRVDNAGDSFLFSTLMLLKANAFLAIGVLFFATVSEVGIGVVQGLHKFRSLIYINLVAGLLSIPLFSILTRTSGVAGVLAARFLLLVIQLVIALIVAQTTLRRMGVGLSSRSLVANGRSLVGFAVPTFISHLVANPARTLMTTYLASMTGGAVQVGLLTSAGRLLSLANFLPGSMGSVILPVLSGIWGRSESEEFQQAVLYSSRMIWFISLPVIIFFVASTPFLLGNLYGPEFVTATSVTILMLSNILLTSINDTGVRVFAAANRQWLTVAMVSGSMVISVAISVWAIPSLQAVGYALALLVSTAVFLAALLVVLLRVFQVPVAQILFILVVSTPVLALAIMIAQVTVGLIQLILALAITGLTLVYMWRFMITRRERQTFRQYATRLVTNLRQLIYRRKGVRTVP